LLVFLKIYIRALQQGSDLSDVVEEKLLIGDRPKLSGDPENKRPLEERLLDRSDEERADVRLHFISLKSSLDPLFGSFLQLRSRFTTIAQLSAIGSVLIMTSAARLPPKSSPRPTRSLNRRRDIR
jgi:hypothetical protein